MGPEFYSLSFILAADMNRASIRFLALVKALSDEENQ